VHHGHHHFNSKGGPTQQEVVGFVGRLVRMSDSADPASHPPWPASRGFVEDMQDGNLQLHVVENMESGGIQHHVAEEMQSGALQLDVAEKMRLGGLQLYTSFGDKERLPSPVQDGQIGPAPPARRKILGLSPRMFWLLAASLVLIAIGAVVGGVVGTQKRRSNTSAYSTVTSGIPQVSSTQPAGYSTTFASSAMSTTSASSTMSTTSPTSTISSSTQSPTTTGPPFITPSRANPVDVDGNYFVNCNTSQGSLSSGAAYYKNLTPGKNIGQEPDDYITVTNGSYVVWENGGTGTSYRFMATPTSCAY
jgi:hypothetical protein